MVQSEIEVVRALLSSKPRPIGWAERRQRLDEIGSVWPVADDAKLAAVNVSGVPGEWSIVPGSDASRILLFFHGGGYCSGSILSHRRMVSEAGRAAGMRTLAVAYRLAPEYPFPAAYDDVLTAWRFLRDQGIPAARIAIGGAGPVPLRAREAERALLGRRLDDAAVREAAALAAAATDPIADLRGSAAYKRAMAGVWTARALRAVA